MEFNKDSWDLSDIKPNSNFYYKRLEELISNIEVYKASFENISKKGFYNVLEWENEVYSLINRMDFGLNLKLCENLIDPKTNQKKLKFEDHKINVFNRLLFIEDNIRKISSKKYQKLIQDLHPEDVKCLEGIRNKKPKLSPIKNLEKSIEVEFLKLKYSQLISGLKIKFKNQEMNKIDIESYFYVSNKKTREQAYKKLHEKYAELSEEITKIYVAIVKDWKNDVDIKSYKSPINLVNKKNKLSDEIVDNLLETVKENQFLFNEYFKLKKRICNIKGKYKRTDIDAPIGYNYKNIPFKKSVKMILETFNEFSPEYKQMAEKMFIKRHVHSLNKKNKEAFNFCIGFPSGDLSYISINYYNNLCSTLILAHELGHAIHFQLRRKKDEESNIFLNSLLSETTAIFSEKLIMEKLISETDDKKLKKYLLTESLDDSFNNISNNAYLTMFEIQAHDLINSSKNINHKQLSELYMSILKEQFGNSLILQNHFKYEWMGLNIFDIPFYNYSYAFGELLSLSLFEEYKSTGKKFLQKYERILTANNSNSIEDILKREGIDITQKSFWQKGLYSIKKNIESLEKLI